MNSLELRLLNTERTLTNAAETPFIGIIPGAAKVGMGTIQTAAAVACLIIFAIPAVAGHQFSRLAERYAWSHIKHGLGNIVAGGLEAIPGMGYSGIFLRQLIQMRAPRFCFDTRQNDKFIPYTTIFPVTGEFGGLDDDYADFFGMRYQEALDLGLINDRFEMARDEIFGAVQRRYNNNEIALQGQFKHQRDALRAAV